MVNSKPTTYGELGIFQIDNDDSYGLYLELFGRDVFVDIRQDEKFEYRKNRARALFENSSLLEKNLHKFINNNPKFKNCVINSIGLHAAEIEQCEVFWDPEGYTLIRGFDFLGE